MRVRELRSRRMMGLPSPRFRLDRRPRHSLPKKLRPLCLWFVLGAGAVTGRERLSYGMLSRTSDEYRGTHGHRENPLAHKAGGFLLLGRQSAKSAGSPRRPLSRNL
jgi:hypothetical protein